MYFISRLTTAALTLALTLMAGRAGAQALVTPERMLNLEDPIEVATYQDLESGERKSITNLDLHRLIVARPLVNQLNTSETFTGDPERTLKPAITEAASRMALYDAARADDAFDPKDKMESIEQEFGPRIQQFAISTLLREEMMSRLSEVDEAEIEQYYQDNYERFNKPRQFSMRNIFLMTYKQVTTGETDTLTSLAINISQDPDAVTLIRDMAKPNEPLLTDEARASSPTFEPALKAGMNVLVPMSADEKNAVRARMESIHQQLEEGAQFEELAIRYSESESRGQTLGPFPSGPKPMLEAIYDAGMSLPIDGVSGVLETKHGFQLIKVVDRTEATTTPLSAVRDQIRATLLTQSQQGARDRFIAHMIDVVGLDINQEALAQPTAPSTQTLVTVGGRYEYTWADLRKDAASKGGIPNSAERRVEIIRNSPTMLTQVGDMYVERRQLTESENFRLISEGTRALILVEQYTRWRAAQDVSLSEAELRAQYQRGAYSQPATLDAFEISATLPADRAQQEQIRLQLHNLTQRVTSEMELRQTMANLEANKSGGYKVTERKQAPSNYRGETLRRALESSPLNRLLGPYRSGGEMLVVWITNRKPGAKLSYEQALPRVRQDLMQGRDRQTVAAFQQKIVESLDVRYKF